MSVSQKAAYRSLLPMPISRRAALKFSMAAPAVFGLGAALQVSTASLGGPRAGAAPLGMLLASSDGVVCATDLKKAGAAGAIRYVCDPRPDEGRQSGKPIQTKDAQDLRRNGLSIVSCFQVGKPDDADWFGGRDAGLRNAERARRLHSAAGGPDSAPIYVSIVGVPTYDQYKRQVMPYLQGWQTIIDRQRVGVYANSKTIDWALADGLGRYYWQRNAGSPNGFIHPASQLQQLRDETWSVGGVTADAAKILRPGYGQWDLPPAAAPPAVGLRMPGNVRLRGVNIVPSFGVKYLPVDKESVWAAMWRTWDWNGWLRPQLDDAAKIANGIRFFGNTACIAQGSVTTADYLARWKQLLDYCAAKNLYVYPCGGDLGHWGDMGYAQATDLYTAWAKLLHAYPNVVGVDVTNEAYGYARGLVSGPTVYKQREPILTLLKNLGDIVRANAGVPVTHSFPLSDPTWWTLDIDPIPQLFAMSDFLDYHVYCDTDPSQAARAFTTPWGHGKHMVIGEFGIDTTSPPEKRTARYRRVRDIVASRPDIEGAVAWSCWDLAGDKTSQYGLYDSRGHLRADISGGFANLPVAR
jgi:glycoside hydrolase-like protein